MRYLDEKELAYQVELSAKEIESRMREIDFTDARARLKWLEESRKMYIACKEYIEYYEGSFEQKDDHRPMRLPSHAWPGGYPIIYIEEPHNEVFCADCAVDLFSPEDESDHIPKISTFVEEEGDAPGYECEGGCGTFVGYGAQLQREVEEENIDYRYIRLWGQMLKSSDSYIKGEIRRAKEEGAPEDSIYESSDGEWVTVRDIQNPEVLRRLGLK
jgi:hypothetical protein